MKDIAHLLDIVEKACVRQPLFHFYSFLRILTHMCIKIKLYTCAFRCVKVRSRCVRDAREIKTALTARQAVRAVCYVNPQERKPQAQRDWMDLL